MMLLGKIWKIIPFSSWLIIVMIISLTCGNIYADTITIRNDNVNAVINPSIGLLSLNENSIPHTSSDFGINFSGDDWAITLQNNNKTLLNSSICNVRKSSSTTVSLDKLNATIHYICNNGYNVDVIYSLPTGENSFIRKVLQVSSKTSSSFFITSVSLWSGLTIKEVSPTTTLPPIWKTFQNGLYNQLEIGGFIRFPRIRRGLFVTIQNPFGTYVSSPVNKTMSFTAQYAAGINQSSDSLPNPNFHKTEGGIIGFTTLGKYNNNLSGGQGLNMGEHRAFTTCVDYFLLDKSSRENHTVKVNVAWDESDYQIDVGTESGRTEYKRIIDRNAQLGITHIVYEPFNSLRASRLNTTDGWGWEGSLWMSMGEEIRVGKWEPLNDPIPPELKEMLEYAKKQGVQLLGYVYPNLDFRKGANVNCAPDLSCMAFQKWLTETLLNFLKVTGNGGFAWDHDIYTDDHSKHYAQWRGWMTILHTLRTEFPDIVMDHRQTNHMWGPWYQLAGSYAEPIAGDENPETYGVLMPTLSTDQVAADHTRQINWAYSQTQLIPHSRIPGFIFHQTERSTDNGTLLCNGKNPCYDHYTRDFDLMGYKYSLLSTIATAGQNLVFTMIPARDMEEFQLFPTEDIDFITLWLKWTDENMKYLANTIPIATLGPPGIGKIDGTAMMTNEEGFIFLFNPNPYMKSASITLDESLGFRLDKNDDNNNNNNNNQVSYYYEVTELYPRPAGTIVGKWKKGDTVSVQLFGSDALVLELRATSVPKSLSTPSQTYLSGLPTVYHAMPISPSNQPPSNFKGGWFNTTFVIPSAIQDQLIERSKKYPIQWDKDDLDATWLSPSRLLGYIYIETFVEYHPLHNDLKLLLMIDDVEVEVHNAYNSRGRVVPRCFLGYYFDATNLAVNKTHSLALDIPMLGKGLSFKGVYWQNVETVFLK